MNYSGFRQTILSALSNVKVYADLVPEKSSLPAIAFTHIANNNNRTLNGEKSATWDTWRASIIAKTKSECDTIVNQLNTLDNTSNSHFKNIFLILEGSVPVSPDDRTVTSFVDFKTYG